MTEWGLSKTRRLHLKNDFQQIIKGGKRLQGCGLVLWYKPSSQTGVRRLGLVVSKKLGGAVIRNRTKRLLREAFRLNQENLTCAVDYIISPRCSEELATLSQVEQALQAVCQKAGLWQPSNAPHKTHVENE